MAELILYQPQRVWGLPSGSPFCIKVELFLRWQGIDYVTKEWNPRHAPRGKMPYVTWRGEPLSDSEQIIKQLCQDLSISLDSSLSPEQRRLSHTLRRMLEEATYFVMLYTRWADDANWAVVKEGFFGQLPQPLKAFVPWLVRRDALKGCHLQGVARYSLKERTQMLHEDITVVKECMDQAGPYYFGADMSSIDLTVCPVLMQLQLNNLPHPLETPLATDNKLLAYTKHINDTFLQDLPEVSS